MHSGDQCYGSVTQSLLLSCVNLDRYTWMGTTQHYSRVFLDGFRGTLSAVSVCRREPKTVIHDIPMDKHGLNI